MNGYLLFRKEEETCLVIKCESDDELIYLLRKLERTRVKWLKKFAQDLIRDFFAKSCDEEPSPQVSVIDTK